jgi:hypothetical protein
MLLHSASEIIDDDEAPRADQGPAEWREVDRRLREYARHRASLDAAEAFDLLRAEQIKLHFLHGFATMYEYLERVMGYGPHAARERMRVARSLAGLPQTTAALARGELTYSAVRELTRVATADTEASWLAAAEGMAVNQIERLVAGHQPGDQPDDPTHPDLRPRVVRIELPPEVYALWRRRDQRRGLRRIAVPSGDRAGHGRPGPEPPDRIPAMRGLPARDAERRRGARSTLRPRCSSARRAMPRSWARSTRRRPSARRPR